MVNCLEAPKVVCYNAHGQTKNQYRGKSLPQNYLKREEDECEQKQKAGMYRSGSSYDRKLRYVRACSHRALE